MEEEGIRRARRKALDSDIVIALASIERDGGGGGGGFAVRADPEPLQPAAGAQQCVIVVNKADVVADAGELSRLLAVFKDSVLAGVPGLGAAEPLLLSCKREAEADNNHHNLGAQLPSGTAADGGGVQALVQRLSQAFEALTSLPADSQELLAVTERQRLLLRQCRRHLDDFTAEAAGPGAEDPDVVLAAEHLRGAADCLARITGRGESGDVEEVLGVIFEKYVSPDPVPPPHKTSRMLTRGAWGVSGQVLRREVIIIRRLKLEKMLVPKECRPLSASGTIRKRALGPPIPTVSR